MKKGAFICIHVLGLFATIGLAFLGRWIRGEEQFLTMDILQFYVLPLLYSALTALVVTLYAGGLACWCWRFSSRFGLLFSGFLLAAVLALGIACFQFGILRGAVDQTLLKFLSAEMAAMLALQGLISFTKAVSAKSK